MIQRFTSSDFYLARVLISFAIVVGSIIFVRASGIELVPSLIVYAICLVALFFLEPWGN